MAGWQAGWQLSSRVYDVFMPIRLGMYIRTSRYLGRLCRGIVSRLQDGIVYIHRLPMMGYDGPGRKA